MDFLATPCPSISREASCWDSAINFLQFLPFAGLSSPFPCPNLETNQTLQSFSRHVSGQNHSPIFENENLNPANHLRAFESRLRQSAIPLIEQGLYSLEEFEKALKDGAISSLLPPLSFLRLKRRRN